jgi:beta-N-acetylhexosaminidase
MAPKTRVSIAMPFALLRFALASLLLVASANYRIPLLVVGRSWMLGGLLGGSSLLIAYQVLRRRSLRGRATALVGLVALLVATGALGTTLAIEARFQWMRHQVLATEPQRLARLGRHLMVGYLSADEVRTLVQKRAIGGVFVTARNVHDKDAAAVRRELDSFQEVRRRTGEPPLWIASDQEGGAVSRLSPPLARQPPLSTLAELCGRDLVACEQAAQRYGALQGRALAELGVNLNFAPVVDVDHHVVNPHDKYTRISQRAIASDPAVVARVADAYCSALGRAGVHCTLKHFPGLGRVFADTHLEPARLDATPSELAESDWLPFRTLMRAPDRFTMLAHVRLTAIDPVHPVSVSKRVVTDLLRGEWGYDGVLVTDDFSMMAIYRSRPGAGGGAVQALNAGVDLVLVSYDADQYYSVMYALLRADRAGGIDREALRRSEARLQRALR